MKTFLFQGDSITDAGRRRDEYGKDSYGYPTFVEGILGAKYPNAFDFINMGVSGNQARDLEARWQTDVFDQNPDWVCVLIGINDVCRQFDTPEIREGHVSPEAYEACYDGLIARTLPRVKGMVLMTPYFMEPNRSDPMRARMDEYGAIVKKLAAKYGLVCVDLQAGWDKLFEHMHPCSIAWDRIHPNQTGCMYIAKQFLAATGFER